MGSLERRLGAVEETLVDRLMLEWMVRQEIEEMLRVLEASEDIEPETYQKVERVIQQRGAHRYGA